MLLGLALRAKAARVPFAEAARGAPLPPTEAALEMRLAERLVRERFLGLDLVHVIDAAPTRQASTPGHLPVCRLLASAEGLVAQSRARPVAVCSGLGRSETLFLLAREGLTGGLSAVVTADEAPEPRERVAVAISRASRDPACAGPPHHVGRWAEQVRSAKDAGCRSWGWIERHTVALARARTEKRLLLVDVYTDWCGWCKKLDREVFADGRVGAAVKDLVAVKVNAEKGGEEIARRYRVRGYPTILFLDGAGNVVERVDGYVDADEMVKLVSALPKS